MNVINTTNQVFWECTEEVGEPNQIIYQNLLDQGKLPKAWRTNIVPLFEKILENCYTDQYQ